MTELIEYLGGLSDEERASALAAMTLEQKRDLAISICHSVQQMAGKLVQNKEHIWLTGELPQG